ncbi:Lipoprotein releasing system transmembrane protein LolE [gamma proteobacterium IMCC1989]|nr:Lipoprotein releasing system transmembrane protein LolE [gamma proteobacterium IMCC1989]
MFSALSNSVSLLLGLRYTIARQRSRSVAFISRVTMMGIVLGVSLLIVVLSVMNGFDKELRERILQIMPQVTLYQTGGMQDWSFLREQLLSNEQIIGVSPFVELQAMVNVGKNTEPTLIYGIDHQLESTTSIIHQFLQPKTRLELVNNKGAIVLGRGLADTLGVNVGSKVSVIVPRAEGQSAPPAIRRLQVIDILNTGTEIDAALALMDIRVAASLSVYGTPISADEKSNNADDQSLVVSGVHLKLDDLFAAASLANNLQAQLPYGFYTTNWTRTHGNIYYAIQMSKKLVSLLLLLIIAIAAFNVVSTLVMVVLDKQSDIAILRTLGASNRQVIAVFMVQGTVISVIGTAIGVCVGVVLAWFVQDIVVFIEALLSVQFLKSDIYPISYLPAQLLWFDVLLVMAVSLSMSFLATLYPAWRATKVLPAEALRYD